MKYCCECGSPLNGEIKCKVCGYRTDGVVEETLVNCDGLRNVIFGSGGAVNTDIITTLIDYREKKIRHVKMPFLSQNIITEVYRISDETLDYIRKTIRDNNMVKWSRFNTEFKPLDKLTRDSLHITIDDEQFLITPNVILNEEQEKIFEDLKEYVLSFMKEEDLIERKEETAEIINSQEVLLG
jgi:hypothetical protein